MSADDKLFSQLKFPSGRTVRRVRQDAKARARERGIPRHQALDELAAENGMSLPWAEAVSFITRTEARLVQAAPDHAIPGHLALGHRATESGVASIYLGGDQLARGTLALGPTSHEQANYLRGLYYQVANKGEGALFIDDSDEAATHPHQGPRSSAKSRKHVTLDFTPPESGRLARGTLALGPTCHEQANYLRGLYYQAANKGEGALFIDDSDEAETRPHQGPRSSAKSRKHITLDFTPPESGRAKFEDAFNPFEGATAEEVTYIVLALQQERTDRDVVWDTRRAELIATISAALVAKCASNGTTLTARMVYNHLVFPRLVALLEDPAVSAQDASKLRDYFATRLVKPAGGEDLKVSDILSSNQAWEQVYFDTMAFVYPLKAMSEAYQHIFEGKPSFSLREAITAKRSIYVRLPMGASQDQSQKGISAALGRMLLASVWVAAGAAAKSRANQPYVLILNGCGNYAHTETLKWLLQGTPRGVATIIGVMDMAELHASSKTLGDFVLANTGNKLVFQSSAGSEGDALIRHCLQNYVEMDGGATRSIHRTIIDRRAAAIQRDKERESLGEVRPGELIAILGKAAYKLQQYSSNT